MLVIVASRRDRAAIELCQYWREFDCSLMTARDLSSSGWRYYPGDLQRSRAVVSGRSIAFSEITGVLTCIPSIAEDELGHIAPEDRAYVAAEMTSFLVACLTRVDFPVVNLPTPACLTGPYWFEGQWLHEAGKIGIKTRRRPVIRTRTSTAADEMITLHHVTVVGRVAIGRVSQRLKHDSLRLAQSAGVEFLTVTFTGPDDDGELVDAYPGGDLSNPEIADALPALFQKSHSAAAAGRGLR